MQDNQPITTVLKIKYKEGFKKECLQWMLETASIAKTFDGFFEKNICISAEAESELLNIFTFRNNECLQVWENSVERIRQTRKGEMFVESIQQKTQLAGLEFMFPSAKSPKRWKMVVITVCVIFILLNSLVPVLQQFFTMLHLPVLLKSLLGVVVMVSLMTFLILPFLSKVLGKWLAG
jgi:antibiotic biosynthesis monooxygenase (ABM) superfamily enzyme